MLREWAGRLGRGIGGKWRESGRERQGGELRTGSTGKWGH